MKWLDRIPERFRSSEAVRLATDHAHREAERLEALEQLGQAEHELAETMPPYARACEEAEQRVLRARAALQAAERDVAGARSRKLGTEATFTHRINRARETLARLADPRIAQLVDRLDDTIERERHPDPATMNSDASGEAYREYARRIAQLVAARQRAAGLYYVGDPTDGLFEVEALLQ